MKSRSTSSRSNKPTGSKPSRSNKPTGSTKPSGSAKPSGAKRTGSTKPTGSAKPGTERARDERRKGGGPRYGGGPWRVADERGEQRFGHARNDDADPSELAAGQAENDDNDAPNAADPDLAAAEAASEIESGGQRAGMSRGEKPRKPKSRTR
jgi:hypothetical protein